MGQSPWKYGLLAGIEMKPAEISRRFPCIDDFDPSNGSHRFSGRVEDLVAQYLCLDLPRDGDALAEEPEEVEASTQCQHDKR